MEEIEIVLNGKDPNSLDIKVAWVLCVLDEDMRLKPISTLGLTNFVIKNTQKNWFRKYIILSFIQNEYRKPLSMLQC
jgi:hypothetical protein